MGLHALSPLDGRYENETSPLREFFSEFAYLRSRARLELDYLAALSGTGLLSLGQLPDGLPDIGDEDIKRMREYELTTRHDVKSIEYLLREKLPAALHPWIHFGLTSEDINNIAQAQALRDSRDRVLLPALDRVLDSLREFAVTYKALPFLARTHGQPAVPSTLGKEIAVYIARLLKWRDAIAQHRFEAKLTGAVGNFNALQAAAPHIDWISFSRDFVQSLGLEPNLITIQILPYDNWLKYFHAVHVVNAALIGYTQDIWRYVSAGLLRQRAVAGEIGSSTMPQKVNPIDFENAEGNLGIANALFTFYEQKLAVSRLQRDLSDSTVRRTFGVALGHTLLAWNNLERGMARIAADEQNIKEELHAHWEVVSEGAQTILRAAGRMEAYETLRNQTRGRVLDETSYRQWASTLDVDEHIRRQLLELTPETYIGLAAELVDTVIRKTATPTRPASE